MTTPLPNNALTHLHPPTSATETTPLTTTESKTQTIWTHQQFQWGIRNPLNSVFSRGNNYVTEQWSEEYLIGCKQNLQLAKTALKSAWKELKAGNKGTSAQHLFNAVVVLVKLGINVQLGNFLKGALGILISTGKLVYHGVEFTLRSLLAIVMCTLGAPALFCNEKCREFFLQNCKEIVASLGFIAKDIASSITSVGHAIPSWIPLAIMAICPPAGLALFLIKNAAKFTGIFDVLGYGGTAFLLYTKAKVAQWNTNSANPQTRAAAKSATEAWDKLKKELNPFKTIEGATLGMYTFHVLVEGASTAASFFLPGADKLIKIGAYGAQAVAGVALAGAIYHNQRQAQATQGSSIPARSNASTSSSVLK